MANYRIDFCVLKDMVDSLLQAPYGSIDPTGASTFVAVREDATVVALVFGRAPTPGSNEVSLTCLDALYLNASCLSGAQLCFAREWAHSISRALTIPECPTAIPVELRYNGCKGCGQICGCTNC